MPVSKRGLAPSEITLAELLKARGYATMLIGKWHLGDQPEFLPTRQGFDRYFGLPYSNDMGGDGKPKKNAKDGKIESRPPLPLLRDDQVIEAPAEQEPLTARYTEEAVKFITAHTNQPFFLYLAHTAVHVPLYPGKAFRGKSANGAYGDWVEESDWSVGRVMDALRKAHLDTNTLVLFTSDNGPWLSKGTNAGSAGPLRGGKFSTWEGGSREPTIAWWPGKIQPGTTSDAVLSQMDVLPTVVRLAGGEVPADRIIDGRDIWPVLSGQSKESPHEALFFFGGNTLEAVRSGPWKLAIAPQGKSRKDDDPDKVPASLKAPRLYNLDRDIGETTDVAAQYPDVVNRLKALVEHMDKDLGLRGDKAPGVHLPGYAENPKPLLKRSGIEYD
jgi:arylsulfatase A